MTREEAKAVDLCYRAATELQHRADPLMLDMLAGVLLSLRGVAVLQHPEIAVTSLSERRAQRENAG